MRTNVWCGKAERGSPKDVFKKEGKLNTQSADHCFDTSIKSSNLPIPNKGKKRTGTAVLFKLIYSIGATLAKLILIV